MRKTILIAAVLATAAGSAVAQPAATDSPHTLTGNLTVATDYRFRGLSQTFRGPTVQGGFDYSHVSGLYLGNWNSSVSTTQFNNGAGIEMDFYGGYKWKLGGDLTADVGLLYYYYPGARYAGNNEKYNNAELYVGGSWKWLSAKYSYGLTDFFGLNTTTAAAGTGTGDSKGSGYLDLTGSWPITEKTTVSAHVGRQMVKNYGAYNYNDYRLGIAHDIGFATVGLSWYKTNASSALYSATNANGSVKQLGEGGLVLSVAKTF